MSLRTTGEQFDPTQYAIENTTVRVDKSSAGPTAQVQIPLVTREFWDVSAGDLYTTYAGGDDLLTLSLQHQEPIKYGKPGKNITLSSISRKTAPLPFRFVRIIGIQDESEIDWRQLSDTEFVGEFTEYYDEYTLLEAVRYYKRNLHESYYSTDEDGEFTSFEQLLLAGRNSVYGDESGVSGLPADSSSQGRQYIPEGVNVSEGDEFILTMFYANSELIIGLFPVEPKEQTTRDGFTKKKRIINAVEATPDSASAEELAEITDAAESYVKQVRSKMRSKFSQITDEDIKEALDDSLIDRYERNYRRQNDDRVSRVGFSPMSASPDLSIDDEDLSAPDVILDYDKPRVRVRSEGDRLFHVVPSEPASAFGLNDGFESDWVQVGDALFSRVRTFTNPLSGEAAS